MSSAAPAVLASPALDAAGDATWTDRHPWLAFAVRRTGRLIVSLCIVLAGSFAMVHFIPGDPVRAALGPTAPASLVAARRHQLGLDKPAFQQFWDYVHGVFTGNLGTSIVSNESVSSIIAAKFPNTLELALVTFVFVIVVALPVGMLMAVYTRGDRHRFSELSFTWLTTILGSLPGFFLGAGLVAVFAITWPVFPVAGKSGVSSYVLPVLSLGLAPAALLARIVRIEGLRVLDEDFMRTARGKRLPARLLYLRHALPNMAAATLTLGGFLLSGLVAGTLLVEIIFAWPGLGTTIADSVQAKDYAVVQGVVLVLGSLVLLVNLAVDVILALLDPRSTIREN